MDTPNDKPKKTRLDDLDNECTSGIDRTIDMLAMSLILTMVFVALSSKSADNIIGDGLPSYNWTLAVKAVIFFIVAYIVDRLIFLWRGDRCYQPNNSL